MADVTNGTGCGDCFAPIIMNTVAEIRRDVAKTEADIKAFNASEFCALGHKVSDEGSMTRLNLANAERDLQNRIHEARLEALRTNADLSKYLADKTQAVDINVVREAGLIKEQLRQFQAESNEKFCEVKTQGLLNTQKIIETLAANKLDEKNEVIESLRHERAHDKWSHAFALNKQEIDYVKQMINSVEQNQKFSSKTVQFGAGNVALPTQTANQG